MDFDGIESPPHPPDHTGSERLYDYLGTLREWVVRQQDQLRPFVRGRRATALSEPPRLHSPAVWSSVSVVDKYAVLSVLRSVRDSWDRLLRDHEDAWDSRLALKKRYNILMAARQVLLEAFVNPELREARNQQVQDEAQRRFKLIQDHLQDVLTPPELKDEDPDPPVPEDDGDWASDEER